MPNVSATPRPRILAMRVRDTLRIPAGPQTIVLPIADLKVFGALTDAVKARHERAAAVRPGRAA
jgi:hypothetical protein